MTRINDQLTSFVAGIENVNQALYELLYEHKAQSLTGMCRDWGVRYTLTEAWACRHAWDL